MTDIHSCGYFCDRPECIKAQRDELRAQVAELERKNTVYADALDAIASRGTHHDTNPTRMLPRDVFGMQADEWWLDYFERADGQVRLIARTAIDSAMKE